MKNVTSNILGENLKIYWIALCILIFSISSVYASDFQDEAPLKTRISLVCTQLGNNKVKVEAQIRAKVDNSYKGINNTELEIYNLTDSSQILIKKEVTDKDGKIQLIIDTKNDLTFRADGYYGILIGYNGDDKHKASEKDIEFKPAFIKVETREEDAVRMLSISVIDLSDSEISPEDLEVVVQIRRMFSNLPIAAETTNEDGMVEIEFPNDLPGGEIGELSIIVKAQDTDEYASLQTQITRNWGIPHSLVKESNKGELWSPNAPLWMVLIFVFLIAIVWVHFGIIIYKLYLINKEGKTLVNLDGNSVLTN